MTDQQADYDGHALVEELRAWTERLPPLGHGDRADLNAIIDRVELWMAKPALDDHGLRAAFRAGWSRGQYDGVREGRAFWAADVPLDEDRWVEHAHQRGLGSVPTEGTAVLGELVAAEPWPRRVTVTSSAPVSITWEC